MESTRIAARGRITIPKAIRESARLRPGDLVGFEMDGDRVLMRKVAEASEPDTYLVWLSEALGEWSSPEDEEAWRSL